MSDSPDWREPEARKSVSSSPNWFEGHVLNPFANALAVEPYNAVANTVNFVTQSDLLAKKAPLAVAQVEFGSPDWFTQNMAGGLGMLLPYAVAGKVAGAGMRSGASQLGFKGTAGAVLNSELAAQVTGAAALDFARDTRAGETRLGNAAGGAMAFYVFGKGNSLMHTDSFWKRQVGRAGVGSAGGVTYLVGSNLVSGQGLPDLQQTFESAISGGTMNLALPPTQRVLSKVLGSGTTGEAASEHSSQPERGSFRGARKFEQPWYSPIQSKYYQAKWAAREGHTEARRMTYALLNKYDLRHPFQRLGDLLLGADDALPASRAKLTPENNPVKALEAELPEFFKRIGERERIIDETPDRKKQYELYEEMKEVRTDFAHRLLRFWHGTAEQPGIKSFTDAELATNGITPERVAEIRKTLQSSGKRDWPNPSPLSQGLADLAGFDLSRRSSRRDSYALDEIEVAKARFFNYDESELSSRMSMPSMHHYKDHAYGTPIDWMPAEPTAKLPNLFHGTVSNSLPSVFTERVIYPASELRLRGIAQNTGESATEHFPRREVSITRDFNEAWAYHRHSPLYLTGFPVVFGISRDVAPRARSAGSLEPGEILIDKMRVGSSWFGLRRPDVTHLYVPDGEVSAVSRLLQRHRVNGVNVVGLNEMPAPKWLPEPTVEELRAQLGY